MSSGGGTVRIVSLLCSPMPGMAGFSGRAGHGPMDFDAVVLAGGLSKQLYPLVSKVRVTMRFKVAGCARLRWIMCEPQ